MDDEIRLPQLPFEIVLNESDPIAIKLPKALSGRGQGIFDMTFEGNIEN